MIDIHCHLLPGVDDGPETLEQSLQLCRIAAADGITHAVVTPHIHPGRWPNNRESVADHCEHLRQALELSGIDLQLGFAAEVRTTDQVMQQVADQEIPYYGEVDGYQIMLLEFPHGHLIPGSEKLVQWLVERGVRPLIAHPERNKQVMRDASRLQPFLELGCWLQITAGSILGSFGERCQLLARQLLDEDLVKVIASDAHNARARPPSLAQAWSRVSQDYGEHRARLLLQENPAAIVAGQFPDLQRACS